MGLFGPSAQELAQRAAEKAVGRAKEAQKRTRKYLGKKIQASKQELSTQQEATGKMTTGLGPQEASSAFLQNFAKTIGDIGTAYSKQLETYDPRVLNSAAAQRFAGVLNASTKNYTNLLNLMSREGSARMYQALAAPISQFQKIANDPAFNNLMDSTYMEYAKNPPTVTSDVESMKNLYTYNV